MTNSVEDVGDVIPQGNKNKKLVFVTASLLEEGSRAGLRLNCVTWNMITLTYNGCQAHECSTSMFFHTFSREGNDKFHSDRRTHQEEPMSLIKGNTQMCLTGKSGLGTGALN